MNLTYTGRGKEGQNTDLYHREGVRIGIVFAHSRE